MARYRNWWKQRQEERKAALEERKAALEERKRQLQEERERREEERKRQEEENQRQEEEANQQQQDADYGNGTLAGTAGNDRLDGTNGADVIVGGKGADLMIGGGGADRFVFNSVEDAPVSGGSWNSVDFIGDFQDGLDSVDLSNIDANTNVGGDQAFNFIGSDNFSGTAGELRVDSRGNVSGDVDGDGAADFNIFVTNNWYQNTVDFDSSDFVL